MSGVNSSLIGQRTNTWNEFINTLPVGTILEVKALDAENGAEVEVLDVLTEELPSAESQSFHPGDRVNTKYGAATVVGVSSRLQVNKSSGSELTDGTVLYVADSDPVVRRAHSGDLSAL